MMHLCKLESEACVKHQVIEIVMVFDY